MSKTNNSTKTEQQEHYESLISLLKYGLSFAGVVVGIITTVALWFTWSNVKDMKGDMKTELADAKESYKGTIKDLNAQISDLKKDASVTIDRIQQDARLAVSSTEDYSQKEISRISSSTKQIALNETQKQLDYIFGTDKIQNLIQNQAVKEIKNKVIDIVSEQTKNVGDISDAAAEMRAYKFSGRSRLRAYFINPKNTFDSAIAKQLYDQISADFFTIMREQADKKEVILSKYDSASLAKLRNKEFPSGTPLAGEVMNIISMVNGTQYDLFQCVWGIYELRIFTNIDFQIIDVEAVNKWYDALKK